MPVHLCDRCRPDSIREFRIAAEARWRDATALAESGRKTGAIYLYGYVVEMLLKAAYFAAVGFGEMRPLIRADFLSARNQARVATIPWQGGLHDLGGWSSALVYTRGRTPGLAYLDSSFGALIQQNSRALQRVWREWLRYHANRAYDFEVRSACSIAEWFRANSSLL